MSESTEPTEGKVVVVVIGAVVGLIAGLIGYALADMPGLFIGMVLGDGLAWYLWRAIQS